MVWFSKKRRKNKLERLYDKYNTVMFKTAIAILQDKAMAEDVVHETFARLLKYNIEIIEDGREMVYLVTACRNVCRDVQKKRAKLGETVEYSDEIASDGAYYNTPQEIVLCDELRAAMVKAIENLDEKYRDVLRMKMAMNMSDKKIAEICGISESAVRQRLSRARARVAEALEKEGLINARTK